MNALLQVGKNTKWSEKVASSLEKKKLQILTLN